MSEQTTDNQPIIIAREVHKWFDNFHALKGINMEVQPGEVVVIFGPSGSGKSTFIRTLNSTCFPTSQSCRISPWRLSGCANGKKSRQKMWL